MTSSRVVWIWVVVAVLVGSALLLCAAVLELQTVYEGFFVDLGVQALLAFGSLALATVPISLFLSFVLQKQMVEEMIRDQDSLKILRSAGVSGAWDHWDGVIDWEDLLDRTDSLTVFVAYSPRWIESSDSTLRTWLDGGGRLKLVLADPANDVTMRALSARQGTKKAPDVIASEIRAHVETARSLTLGTQSRSGEIYFYPEPLTFSFYLADKEAFLGLQAHRVDPATPPVLILKLRNGPLLNWLKKESSWILEQATQVPEK